MDDELTVQQCDLLRESLQTRRAELRRAVEDDLADADDENLNALAGEVRDAGDEALAGLLADMNLDHLQRETQELREVESALAAMDSGLYGRCEACGDSIPFERLQARPQAQRCLPCQERAEREGLSPMSP